MRFKDGVDLSGVRPELVLAMSVADGVYNAFGEMLVITSVMDGEHMPASLHYVGAAFDCRYPVHSDAVVRSVVSQLRRALGPQYDVVEEETHLHIEFQPKE